MTSDLLTALLAAHTHFAIGAGLAAEQDNRPGSFAAAFLDALDAVDASNLRAKGQVQEAVMLAN